MNILIINGSPRIHGNISAMLDAIREEAEQRGAEVTTVLASRLQVKPCTGCMTCRETHHCVLPEDDATVCTCCHKKLRCAGCRSTLLLGK